CYRQRQREKLSCCTRKGDIVYDVKDDRSDAGRHQGKSAHPGGQSGPELKRDRGEVERLLGDKIGDLGIGPVGGGDWTGGAIDKQRYTTCQVADAIEIVVNTVALQAAPITHDADQRREDVE